jgi:hypothetical protein
MKNCKDKNPELLSFDSYEEYLNKLQDDITNSVHQQQLDKRHEQLIVQYNKLDNNKKMRLAAAARVWRAPHSAPRVTRIVTNCVSRALMCR